MLVKNYILVPAVFLQNHIGFSDIGATTESWILRLM